MKLSARQGLLLLMLLAAALLVIWDRSRPAIAPQPGGLAEAVVRRPAAQASAALASTPSLRSRQIYQQTASDLFETARVEAASPVTAAAQSAPPPALALPEQAPPLPFTVLGKKLEGGQWEVYLLQGEQVQIARAGSRLGEHYTVEQIGPAQMLLVYLPLNQKQSLDIGAPLND